MVRKARLLLALLVICGVAPTAPANAEAQTPFFASVRSFDGVMLGGTIRLPAATGRFPVVLQSSPYFGYSWPAGDSPLYDAGATANPVPVAKLLEWGYAVAQFSVRGTGSSGGCQDLFGPSELRDQKVLVDWLARQGWSTGRVGMMGESYDAATQMEAAVQAPRALKLIIPQAPVIDLFTLESTPQGAVYPVITPQLHSGYISQGTLPPVVGGAATIEDAAKNPRTSERLCEATSRQLMNGALTAASEHRDAEWFRDRSVVSRLKNIRAAVLLGQGFFDDQYWQVDTVWNALRSPKHFVLGQFPHIDPGTVVASWPQTVHAWLDYFVKGKGLKPRDIGTVDWSETADPMYPQVNPPLFVANSRWHRSKAWPPPERRTETVYLSGAALTAAKGRDSRTYQSFPTAESMTQPVFGPGGYYNPKIVPCGTEAADVSPTRLAFSTAPVQRATVLAGNSFAYLKLKIDRPGGIVTVDTYDVGPGGCDGGGPDATLISEGAADLRFFRGNFDAIPPAAGRSFDVRIDLSWNARRIEPGHRLVAVVSAGDAYDHIDSLLPSVTVDGTSHLVLPIITGTFGGKAPRTRYPARPFAAS